MGLMMERSGKPPAMQNRLLAAWQDRNLDAFQEIVKADEVKPNYVYPEEGYQTLLELFAESSFQNIEGFVEAMINAGAMPNLMNTISGKAPLHVAAQELNYAFMELLLEKGADVNVEDSSGNIPLHILVRKVASKDTKRQKDCLQLLAGNSKTNWNHRNRKGLTPVQIALQQGAKSVLEILLQQGSLLDVDTKPPGGNKRSVRDEITEKYPDLINKLPPAVQPNWAVKMDGPKLFTLLGSDEEHRFSVAFEKEMKDQSQRSLLFFHNGKQTFLQYAVQHGHYDAAETLLKHGADVNQIAPAGISPLQQACLDGNLNMLDLILEYNPNLSPDHNGETVLHILSKVSSFSEDHAKCLKRLLRTNLDINAADMYGRTALHYASYFPHNEAVQLLLDSGANLFLVDNFEDAPYKNLNFELLESYFDSKVSWNYSRGDKCAITMDLNFLNPNVNNNFDTTEEDDGEALDNLHTEAENLQNLSNIAQFFPLLAHPLIKGFITHKWRLIRHFFHLEIAVYILFCLLLFLFVTYNVSHSEASALEVFVKVLLIFFLFVRYILEILVVAAGPFRFFTNVQRWSNLLLTILCTIVVAKDCGRNISESSWSKFCPLLLYFVSLLAAVQFIFIIGKHPKCALSFAIMKALSKRCLLVILVYIIPLIAFAVGWYALSRDCQTNGCTFSYFGGFLFPVPFKEVSQGFTIEKNSQLPFLLFCFLLLLILMHLVGIGVVECVNIMKNKEAYTLREQLIYISLLEETFISNPRARLQQFEQFTQYRLQVPWLKNLIRKILFFAKGDGKLILLINHSNELVTNRQQNRKRSPWNTPCHLPKKCVLDLEKRVSVKSESSTEDPKPANVVMETKMDMLLSRTKMLALQIDSLEETSKQVEKLLIQSLAVLSLQNSQSQ